MSRTPKDIEVTPEVRRLITTARKAVRVANRAQEQLKEAAHQRQDAIAALTEHGMSARQIAEKVGITEAAVYLTRSRTRKH